MKQYMMYECEKCGYKSKSSLKVEECEAFHLDLTLEEYRQYKELKKKAEDCGRMTSVCKNEQTDEEFNKAINNLIVFEKDHNLVN